jgi:hypothetical protein
MDSRRSFTPHLVSRQISDELRPAERWSMRVAVSVAFDISSAAAARSSVGCFQQGHDDPFLLVVLAGTARCVAHTRLLGNTPALN